MIRIAVVIVIMLNNLQSKDYPLLDIFDRLVLDKFSETLDLFCVKYDMPV